MARPKRVSDMFNEKVPKVERIVYLLEKAKRRIFLPLECKEYIEKAILEVNKIMAHLKKVFTDEEMPEIPYRDKQYRIIARKRHKAAKKRRGNFWERDW